MLGQFSRTEVEELSRLVRRLNGSLDWSVATFSREKSYLMARLSQMAYAAVGHEERAHPARAKLVPSDTFQAVVRSGAFDFLAAARSGDFEVAIVVRSAFFVAFILQIHSDIFVAIRGTAFAYDWGINLDTQRRYGDPVWRYWRGPMDERPCSDYEGFLHSGFYREAVILSHLISERIQHLRDGDTRIHLGGHSLGGAVAAVLAMRGFRRINEHLGRPEAADTYIFGAPRIGDSRAVRDAVVYAVRRESDLVPHTPPTWMGYSDYLFELGTDGLPYGRPRSALRPRLGWLKRLYIPLAFEDHKLETYVREMENPLQPNLLP